jgi:hypothetical protein
MDKVLGENVQFQIEVESDAVLLVLDRKCDWCLMPWQDAFRLAQVMEQVIEDVRKDFTPTSFLITQQEQSQIRFAHHKGLVALLVTWTDRVRFTSLDAFYLVQKALMKTAQDAQLSCQGIHFEYDRQGLIRKLHNLHRDEVQFVR